MFIIYIHVYYIYNHNAYFNYIKNIHLMNYIYFIKLNVYLNIFIYILNECYYI